MRASSHQVAFALALVGLGGLSLWFTPGAAANSADLYISHLAAVKLVEEGTVKITATVTNGGPQACGPFTLKIGANCADGSKRVNPYAVAGLISGGFVTHTATFPLWCEEGASYCTWADARFDQASVDSDPDLSDNYASTNTVTVIFDGGRYRDFHLPIHNMLNTATTILLDIPAPPPSGWTAVLDPPVITVPPDAVELVTMHVYPPTQITEYPVIQAMAHYPAGLMHDVDFTYVTSPGTAMWSDNFNDGNISDWEVHAVGGSFNPSSQCVSPPLGLAMNSMGSGEAWGWSPPYEFDQYSDYKISFWFKLPSTNNHWFVVMDNGHVQLVIDYNTDLKAWTGTVALPLMPLTPGQWYFIECCAHPQNRNYDIFVDGLQRGTAPFLEPDAQPRVRVGDIHTGSTDRGAAFWDDIVVQGVPLPPDTDVEICDWPRPPHWWLGAHIYTDRQEIHPGETAGVFATVRNLGTDTATNVTVTCCYSDPTLAERFPDYDLHEIASEVVAEIAPGDSVMTGPFFFTAPPGGNCFGEPNWNFVVRCESAEDPYTTGWPEEDNNVACRAFWQKQVDPGVLRSVHFWISNPHPDPMQATLELDTSGLPTGWVATLSPPAGQMIALAPWAKVEGEIEITPSEEGESATFVVSELLYQAGGMFDRITGGLGGQFFLTRDVFVEYDHIPTQADETALGTLIGAGKIKYRCKYIPHICVRGVAFGLLDDILDLSGVTQTISMPGVTHWLDVSARAIKARASGTYSPQTAEDLGYDGTGINIAILDTGVDDNHPSLAGKYVAGLDAVMNLEINPDDDFNTIFHGTHCAGIAMGTGGNEQTYRGVAPGAGLIDVKVLTHLGSGFQDDIIQGVEWCIEHREEHDIRVLSMSLGSRSATDGSDPQSQIVNVAVDSGLVVVVSAGNNGPDNDGLGSPGAADKAITVASMNDSSTVSRDDDTISHFSSRGPRWDDGDADEEDELKPTITAPGGDGDDDQIMSARGIGGGSQAAVGYHDMSGTSMACPHVAGVVALMLQADPSLTPAQVKNMLINTADDWGPAGWDSAYGYGYVDAYDVVGEAMPQPDAEICHWFREEHFWAGVHIDLPIELLGGHVYQGFALVKNVGRLATAAGSVRLYAGDATSCLHYPPESMSPLGTVPCPPLAPGDSARVGPFNFSTAPGGNSFGQPYWSFVATVECPDDPIVTGWPKIDNNVACRSRWQTQGAAGEVQELRFWIRNPLTEPAKVVMYLDREEIPSGWAVELVPPAGDTLAIAPQTSLPAVLRVTPTSGSGTVYLTELLHSYTGRFLQVAGGTMFTVQVPMSDVTSDPISQRPPLRFAVNGNSPNPFSSRTSTLIRYAVPRQAEIELVVYNVAGQRVRELFEGEVAPGYHQIVWDGRNDAGIPASAGVYFCVLRSGEFRPARRMLLLK